MLTTRRWLRRLWLGALLLTALGTSLPAAARDGEWQPAPAPLMTRWAREVRPDRVRAEYPRPLMTRKEWLNLNGPWQFDFDDADRGRKEGWSSGREFPRRILVPFTFEAALSGIGRGSEIHERVWYHRTLTGVT